MFCSPKLPSYFLPAQEKEQKSYLGTTAEVKLVFISLIVNYIEIGCKIETVKQKYVSYIIALTSPLIKKMYEIDIFVCCISLKEFRSISLERKF